MNFEQKVLQFVSLEGVRVRVMRFQQRIGTAGFTAGAAFGHKIGKFADVPAGLEDGIRGDGRA